MGIFSLMKTSAKIGEDIVGVFSFTEGTVPCVQVKLVWITKIRNKRANIYFLFEIIALFF